MTKEELKNLKPGDRVKLRLPKETESAFNGATATVVEIIKDGATVRLGRNKRETPVIFDRTEIYLR